MTEQLPPPGGEPEDVWNRILRTALAMPGARVDRKAFLRKALSKHVTKDVWQRAIDTTPAKAGVSKDTIRRVATSSIKWHRAGVSSVSFATGLPGGWWVAGTMPADLTQFFWHVLVILQKLAYLYGWPELLSEDGELDDETLLIPTVFIGVMFGAESAGKILGDLAERVAAQVLKRLPRETLTKWGLYRLAREVAKWIGIKLTKESFARFLAKLVPILGGIISGTITWVAFSLMTNRLAIHLESLPLASSDEALGARRETFEELRTLIVRQLGVNPEDVRLTASFIGDFGADNLDMMALRMAIQEDFSIELDLPYGSEEPVTVADALAFVEQHRNN